MQKMKTETLSIPARSITAICVGGPLAGHKRTILHGNRLRAPLHERLSLSVADIDPSKLKTLSFVDYGLERHHTPQGTIFLWVPDGQAPIETMTLLIEGYARSPVANADEINNAKK